MAHGELPPMATFPPARMAVAVFFEVGSAGTGVHRCVPAVSFCRTERSLSASRVEETAFARSVAIQASGIPVTIPYCRRPASLRKPCIVAFPRGSTAVESVSVSFVEEDLD